MAEQAEQQVEHPILVQEAQVQVQVDEEEEKHDAQLLPVDENPQVVNDPPVRVVPAI